MISLILPTYNEAKNIAVLIPRIHTYLGKYTYEMIVVDDNSPDGTAKVAKQLKREGYPVRVIVRKNERGLASATLRGFQNARYSVIGVMDTDMQHDPKYLPKLYAAIENGADMAIGSRYTNGSGFEGWPLVRKLISKTAILLTRPLTKVKDPLGEFFMVKKRIVDGLQFENIGCRLSLEIQVKGNPTVITEVPIIFNDRKFGESKVLKMKTVIEDMKLLAFLYAFSLNKQWNAMTRAIAKVMVRS